MYNLNGINQYLKNKDEKDYIPQTPYTLKETWDTPPISEISEKGLGSPVYEKEGHRWRMIIFPKGYKQNTHLTIFIMAVKIQEAHKVDYTITISNGSLIKTHHSDHLFTPQQNSRGITEFILLSELENYLIEGKLHIELKITFTPPRSNSAQGSRSSTGYIGLKNQGATCYMNSILQSLFFTAEFRRRVYQFQTAPDYDLQPSLPLALQQLFILMQWSPIAVSTYDFTTAFGFKGFENFVQQDTQEFLGQLFDRLEKLINVDNVRELFKIKTVTTIQCPSIDYVSTREEIIFDIPVSIQEKSGLEESLTSSSVKEFLDGDNQYEVEGKGKFDAEMYSNFKELPPVLHFHLQRYDMYERKIQSRFEFPLILNMAPFLNEQPEGPVNYELIGVLVHVGSSYGGHYLAYCRPTIENKWFCFNDESVSEVLESEAIEGNFGGNRTFQTAYFLVYVKQTQIQDIMKPVKDDEIPTFLKECYDDWKISKQGEAKRIKIHFFNEQQYFDVVEIHHFIPKNMPPVVKLTVSNNLTFKELLPEIREKLKIQEEEPSLWVIDEFGLPSKLVDFTKDLKSFQNTSSILRIFVSSPSSQNCIPIFLGIDNPLRLEGFFPMDPSSPLNSLELPIRMKYHLEDKQKLKAYVCKNDEHGYEVDSSKSLKSFNVSQGLIVFKALKDEKIGPLYSPAHIH